jgi:hypothetical protein
MIRRAMSSANRGDAIVRSPPSWRNSADRECAVTRPRAARPPLCADAQTPGKTRGQDGPESRTNQRESRSGPVCKTPIPGSNPGGASKFRVQIRRNVLQQYNPVPRNWTTVDYKSRGRRGRIPANHCVRTVSPFASSNEVWRTSALSRVVMVRVRLPEWLLTAA